MSNLGKRMSELVRACFTGIWIKTYEPDDATQEIMRLCHSEDWGVMTWDLAHGLRASGSPTPSSEAIDPLGALKTLASVPDNVPTILVLRNYHRFIGSGEVVAELAKLVVDGKIHRKFVVIL